MDVKIVWEWICQSDQWKCAVVGVDTSCFDDYWSFLPTKSYSVAAYYYAATRY